MAALPLKDQANNDLLDQAGTALTEQAEISGSPSTTVEPGRTAWRGTWRGTFRGA